MHCRQNTHKIRISIPHGDNQNVVFYRCCWKEEPNEELFRMPLTEFNALSKEELQNIIKSMNGKIPENHNYDIFPSCYSDIGCCNYIDDDINTVAISIQYKCNLKCIMCCQRFKETYARHDDALYKEAYFNTLNKIKGMHLDQIELTERGEPFFYKKEIMEYLESLTLNDCKVVFIISNLVALTHDDIERLHNISVRSGIRILIIASCSGITEDTYKIIHGNVHFNRVVENIKHLDRLGLLLQINFVATPENIFELNMYESFWRDNGVKASLDANYVVPGAHPISNCDEIILNSPEWKTYIANKAQRG